MTILTNIERILPNAGKILISDYFIFEDTGRKVTVGIPYTIVYTTDKKEYYFTGKQYSKTSKRIIRKRGYTTIGEYLHAKSNKVESTVFLTPNKPKPKKSETIMSRFFATSRSDIITSVFEISNRDYVKETPYYKKYKINWKLTGKKKDVIEYNQNQVTKMSNFFKQDVVLNLLEYWIPDTLSKKDEILQKINKVWIT